MSQDYGISPHSGPLCHQQNLKAYCYLYQKKDTEQRYKIRQPSITAVLCPLKKSNATEKRVCEYVLLLLSTLLDSSPRCSSCPVESGQGGWSCMSMTAGPHCCRSLWELPGGRPSLSAHSTHCQLGPRGPRGPCSSPAAAEAPTQGQPRRELCVRATKCHT